MISKVKVVGFDFYYVVELTDSINNWLSEHTNIDVVDIKYSSSSCVDDRAIYNTFSALILYTEN